MTKPLSSLLGGAAAAVPLLFLALCTAARAQVPANETFTFVNDGNPGSFVVLDGSFRMLNLVNGPFQLGFYYNYEVNPDGGDFFLGLLLGPARSSAVSKWVWEANRGNPVDANATFSLNRAGNLVLARSDGRVAWQSNTANKGVVGLKLLSTGNMVLYDKAGKFVWQSFDHPTDTLLVGQTLRLGDKLVSRLSAVENKAGRYSLVLEPNGFSLYKDKSLYFSQGQRFPRDYQVFPNMTLIVTPESDEAFAYSMTLTIPNVGDYFLARPKYNATFSFLRLGMDGSLIVYTYYDKVQFQEFEAVFSIFNRDNLQEWSSECQLPERCGSLGVCEDNQCVACPTESGQSGYSKSCRARPVTSCRPTDFRYYEVKGVDHYLAKYNAGSAVKESECGKKCSSDCKCMGYFYNRDSARCWVADDLMTLTRANSTHVGFIKTPNK